MTHPGQQPYPPRPVPPRPPKKPNTKIAWMIGGGVVAAFVVLAIIGNLIKDDEPASTVSVPSTWATLPDPTTTAAPSPSPAAASTTTPPKLERTATATPSPDFPAGLSPRCSKAPADLVAAVSAGLKNKNHEIAHAVLVYGSDGYEYLGASIVDKSGLLIQRSDVWVRGLGRVWAASGGARNESTFDRASRGLGVDLAGEDFVTADECARAWAKVSGY